MKQGGRFLSISVQPVAVGNLALKMLSCRAHLEESLLRSRQIHFLKLDQTLQISYGLEHCLVKEVKV